MKDKAPRTAFCFLMLFLFLLFQFIFSLKIKEPYPAILFPGFGNVHENLSEIEIGKYQITVTFSNDQDTILNAASVFNSFPNWYVSRVCTHLLHQESSKELSAEKKIFEQWLKQKIEKATNREDLLQAELSKHINTFSLEERKIIKEKQVLARRFNLKH